MVTWANMWAPLDREVLAGCDCIAADSFTSLFLLLLKIKPQWACFLACTSAQVSFGERYLLQWESTAWGWADLVGSFTSWCSEPSQCDLRAYKSETQRPLRGVNMRGWSWITVSHLRAAALSSFSSLWTLIFMGDTSISFSALPGPLSLWIRGDLTHLPKYKHPVRKEKNQPLQKGAWLLSPVS